MHDEHRYRTELRWSGSTAAGYEHYPRAHELAAPPAVAQLELTSDPSFRGDPERWNPEQLVVAAASSCQLLSFLAIAARARIDVVDYRDDASATMRTDQQPARLEVIELHPVITVRTDASDERLDRLVHLAHDECYIANSLATPVIVQATFNRM